MNISFDLAKREQTLRNRGLDFADAGQVFMGPTATTQDFRFNYGEDRFITAGCLNGRCVFIVWTPRAGSRRITAMKHAHADKEKTCFG